MNIEAVINAYDRQRQALDETHFEFALEALKDFVDANLYDVLEIEIDRESHKIEFRLDGIVPAANEILQRDFQMSSLNRLLMNVNSAEAVRIEITQHGYDIDYGRVFLKFLQFTDSDEEG